MLGYVPIKELSRLALPLRVARQLHYTDGQGFIDANLPGINKL